MLETLNYNLNEILTSELYAHMAIITVPYKAYLQSLQTYLMLLGFIVQIDIFYNNVFHNKPLCKSAVKIIY